MENNFFLASQDAKLNNESVNTVASGEVKTPEPKGAQEASVENLPNISEVFGKIDNAWKACQGHFSSTAVDNVGNIVFVCDKSTMNEDHTFLSSFLSSFGCSITGVTECEDEQFPNHVSCHTNANAKVVESIYRFNTSESAHSYKDSDLEQFNIVADVNYCLEVRCKREDSLVVRDLVKGVMSQHSHNIVRCENCEMEDETPGVLFTTDMDAVEFWRETTFNEEIKFDSSKIYSLTELKNAGYIFGYISTNRKPKDLNVDKKVASFKKSKGLITPCLIVKAEDCIKEGLEVVTVDGRPIKDLNVLKRTLAVIDGQHRFLAILKYNEEMEKEGGSKLECHFHFPLSEGVDIVSMLREANVATVPWKGGDYLTNIISMKHEDGIDLSKFNWVQDHLGTCGDSAAWIWANFREKVYSKSDMIKAGNDDKLLKDLSNLDKFEFGKALYEATYNKLGQSIVKLKVTPLTLVSIYDSETQTKTGESVVRELEDFINSISSEDVEFIKKIKRIDKDEKTKAVTKDSQIEDKLRELWDKYKATHLKDKAA